MARACSICTHPQRREIDAAVAAGTPLRVIAREFATTHTALGRHRAHIVPGTPIVPSAAPSIAPSAPTAAETEQTQTRRHQGRQCTVCTHPEHSNINAALVTGASYRDIAAQYGLVHASIARHAATHLPAQLAHAQHVEEVASASGLLLQIQSLQSEAAALLERAKTTGDIRAAAAVLAQQGRFIELLAKVEGQLQGDGPTVNVLVSQDWQRIRGVIVAALAPHPEARIAVAAALEHQAP